MRMQDILTRLLGAAIMLIAAYVLPSPAQAHEGHGLSAAAGAAVASPVTHASTAAHAHSASPTLVATAERSAPAMPGPPCGRDCCNPGMVCCLSALVVDPVLALPLATSRRQEPLRAMVMPPGRVPEALPKPPRTPA